MPYRIDVRCPPSDALDVLVELGALDIEQVKTGLPPSYRDNGSIWLVSARPVRVGSFSVVSPEVIAQPRALRLVDSPAFGTGHDPTTALCVEALEEILSVECPDSCRSSKLNS